MWATYTISSKAWKVEALHATAIVCTLSCVLYLPIYFLFLPSNIGMHNVGEAVFQGVYQGTTPVTGASISAVSNTNWNPPVSLCDSLDFNGDGNIDPTDVDAYFSVLGEGPCLPANTNCNDLDFNNDGNIDPADVDAYFSVLGEGPCL